MAPLASDIDLSCPAYPNENMAYYDMSEDPDLLSEAKSMVADETGHNLFYPHSLIMVTWYKVQHHGCLDNRKVRVTFQNTIKGCLDFRDELSCSKT